jgi:PST family polysaccharide transporter
MDVSPAAGNPRGTAAPPPAIERLAARSFGWALLSFGGNRLVVFVSTLVLARLLAPQDFGVVAAALTLTSYLELGLDLGIGAALIYEQEEGVTPRVQTAFTLNLLLGAVLFAAAFLAAPLTARFFQVPGQDAIFRALALVLLIRGAGQVNVAILRRDLRFKPLVLLDVVRGSMRAAVAVLLALAGYRAWAIVWGFLAGELAGMAVGWMIVRFPPRLRFDRAASASLLRYGLSLVGVKALDEIGDNSDYLVVGNRLGPLQLGFYSMAFRLPELVVTNVFWIFSSVAFPVYSKTKALGQETFRRAMLRALRLTTLYGFAAGTGLALVARDAVVVLFSPKWQPAGAPMALISLALGVSSVGFASGDIFPALGRPGALLKLNLPLSVVLVAGFVLAAPHGIVAVAWVHLIYNLVYAFLRLAMANRLVGATFAEDLAAMRPGLCAAAGIALCAWPVRLAVPPGMASLLATISAGVAGGLAGLLIGSRSTLGDLRALARQALGR